MRLIVDTLTPDNIVPVDLNPKSKLREYKFALK